MLFNFNTLKIELDPTTKSLIIRLNRPEIQNAINTEMLFELESMLAWLTSHLEVRSVVLTSTIDIFSVGLDKSEMVLMSEEKLKRYLARFQKIVAGMLHLPQTMVCDLGEAAEAEALELAMGADIRVARRDCQVRFNHLTKGLSPACGGVALLSQLVGHAHARNWMLTSKKVTAQEMLFAGFAIDAYPASDKSHLQNILKSIAAQAPIARIQCKRAFLECIMPEMERGAQYEAAFNHANLSCGDWERAAQAHVQGDTPSFTNPRDLAAQLKKVLRQ